MVTYPAVTPSSRSRGSTDLRPATARSCTPLATGQDGLIDSHEHDVRVGSGHAPNCALRPCARPAAPMYQNMIVHTRTPVAQLLQCPPTQRWSAGIDDDHHLTYDLRWRRPR